MLFPRDAALAAGPQRRAIKGTGHSEPIASSFTRPLLRLPGLLLPLAGIVVGVDVLDDPRPLSVDLNYRLAPGPAKVFHPRWHSCVRSCGQGHPLLLIELA